MLRENVGQKDLEALRLSFFDFPMVAGLLLYELFASSRALVQT